jgi:hypothetical protein
MMLTTCSDPGCETLVLGGGRCIEHELRQSRVFDRGRAFVATVGGGQASVRGGASFASAPNVRGRERRTAYAALDRP